MRTLKVVKVKVLLDSAKQVFSIGILFEVEVFGFEASPQSFDPNVVDTSPSSIHTYRYLVALQNMEERFAGKLTTLVAVEYLGLSEKKGVL